MSSGREREQIPQEFDPKKKTEAEFWAWLTEGHILVTDLSKSSNEAKPDRKIAVLSKDEIKLKIQEAMKKNERQQVQELLEIVAKPSEGLSKEMARKSVRVGSGEYVKLLYVKILERTSFAEVIMNVLLKPCKVKVEELKSKFYGHSFPIANKLDNLIKAIDEWETEKPESRASMAEWGEWGKVLHSSSLPKTPQARANEWDYTEATTPEGGKPFSWLTPFYPPSLQQKENLEKTKAALSGFAFSDIMAKLTGGDYDKPVSGIFDEFKDEWKQQIEKEFPQQVGVRATVENRDQNLLFSFSFAVITSFNAKREQELFDKYGQDEVKDFVNKILLSGGESVPGKCQYEGITNSEKYKGLIDPRGVEEANFGSFNIYIGTFVEFPCCRVIIDNPRLFQLERVPDVPSGFENDRQQFKAMVLKMSEKIGRRDLVERVKGFANKRESKELNDADFSLLASNIIPEAVSKASSSDDYKEINNLMTIQNKLSNYNALMGFTEDLVESTLSHYSVVSFYINRDLWRLVPLVLEGKNWITLVDEYLKDKL
ncbi:MAG: hypothetical protein ABSC91_09635 [Candidatus Bathyarchaeia archaeon]|jgi:hypothetical protein